MAREQLLEPAARAELEVALQAAAHREARARERYEAILRLCEGEGRRDEQTKLLGELATARESAVAAVQNAQRDESQSAGQVAAERAARQALEPELAAAAKADARLAQAYLSQSGRHGH